MIKNWINNVLKNFKNLALENKTESEKENITIIEKEEVVEKIKEKRIVPEYKETTNLSPNSSGTLKPEGIVIHHSGGSWGGLVPWITNPKSKASYHVVVNIDGNRVIVVPDNKRAWHAGISEFKGKSNCNNFLLGIAVSGDTTKRELTPDEIMSVAQWCISKMKLYDFGIDDITTHEAITQIRKTNKKIDVSKKAFEQIIEEIKLQLEE
jgi:AmpD protein